MYLTLSSQHGEVGGGVAPVLIRLLPKVWPSCTSGSVEGAWPLCLSVFYRRHGLRPKFCYITLIKASMQLQTHQLPRNVKFRDQIS